MVVLNIILICVSVTLLTLHFPHTNQNPKKMTTPSSDLRQAQPHKPVLTLCKHVIFKAQGPPARDVDESNEKMMTEEHSGV